MLCSADDAETAGAAISGVPSLSKTAILTAPGAT
jgi:hypothetical protein